MTPGDLSVRTSTISTLPQALPTSRKAKIPQWPGRRRDRFVYVGRAKGEVRAYPTVPGADGQQHRYLNAAIPRDPLTGEPIAPLQAAICGSPGRCGHAYSQLMVAAKTGGNEIAGDSREQICEECQLEEIAELARELQEAGIPLGWGALTVSDRRRYTSSREMGGVHLIRRRT